MASDSCSRCGRVIWQSEKFCSTCGIAPDATDNWSNLFREASRTPKKKCPRCGWKCRCVAVLFLYDRQS